MLKWAAIFFIISVIAGALGMTNLASGARRISLILFAIFLVIALALVGFALLVTNAVT